LAKDYYAVLGLLPTAELVVIKAAYRALAQRYHPDKFSGDPAVARSKMEDLNEAYRVLSNPQRRQAHDQELMVDLADLDDSYAEWIRAFVRARKHGD
jgi:curved DNA-binding protein CbpA